MSIAYSEKKLVELILYVADKCALDTYYGVLKLNKILFYSDFTAFKTCGAPITGAEYRKYPHGPAPCAMKPLKERLEHDAVVYEWQHFLPTMNGPVTEKRLFARRKPDLSVFGPEEIVIVDEVIDRLRPMTGNDVSLMSHRHPGWRLATMNSEIPYVAALLPEGPAEPLSAKDLTRARSAARRFAIAS